MSDFLLSLNNLIYNLIVFYFEKYIICYARMGSSRAMKQQKSTSRLELGGKSGCFLTDAHGISVLLSHSR